MTQARGEPAPRVLYVGGWGRSGSTLLDRMVGQVPGCVSLGEVREIWQSGLAENRLCGCGTAFLECPFWEKVAQEAFGGWSRIDLAQTLRLWRSLDRPWALPMLLARRTGDGLTSRYVDLLTLLYRAVWKVTGAKLLIDSSKLPTHALLLRRVPGLDLRLVHLIRDSRGVAHSWDKRVRDRGTGGAVEMERYHPAASALRWLLYNEPTRFTRHVGIPYRLLRYEDMVRRPAASLREVLAHAGIEPQAGALGFVGEGEVSLGVDHTVDGNPLRFTVGRVPLRLDEAWRLEMRPSDRRLVTAITYPRLRTYHYEPEAIGG